MPTALVLTLRPLQSATVAAHLGRASHAALLRALAERDAALAQRLHDLETLKPFAASDLLGVPPGRVEQVVQVDQAYKLRWCGLSQELDAIVQALAADPPEIIQLDDTDFAVERATLDAAVDPWAGVANWSDLLALEQIGRTTPPHRFVLHFAAPTTFRSSGRNVPLPLPDLVFGSLLERWNAVAPITLPQEVRRFAAQCLVIGRYSLQSCRVSTFGGAETAFIGRCSFVATNRDRYYLHCCAALLRFAFFSGVGAKTSMGFGLVRSEEHKSRNRQDGPAA